MKKMTLRITAVFLCFVMCFSLGSCEFAQFVYDEISSLVKPQHGMVEDTSLGYTQIEKIAFSYSEYYTPFDSKEAYNSLENDKMRELYDVLFENVYFVYPQAKDGEYKTKQAVIEESALTEAQVRLTIKALTDDNPEIFWLSSTFGFLIHDEYKYTAVQLYSRYSPTELKTRVEDFTSSVNTFYTKLEKGMSEYQRELFIHDYIIDNCEYDESVILNENTITTRSDVFESYGALVDNLAVCEGYSRAFQMLCHGVGIKCINLIGQSEDVLHMWSAVELGGDWYYVDTTWDDNDDEAFRYDYFNINEKQLTKDHEFSPLAEKMSEEEINGTSDINAQTSNFTIPECSGKAYNYYVRESVHLKDYYDNDIVDSLISSAMKKEKYFHFYIEPKALDYEEAVDVLFSSYPQHFFNYIYEANNSIPDYSIEYNDLMMYKKDSLSVVTVVLEYI